MNDDEDIATELEDFELSEILKFYKNKYVFNVKEASRDIADIMLPEILNQAPPVCANIVDENESEFSNIIAERISFDQANMRLDEWFKDLDRREQYKIAQIIQEIARDTLVKEIDSGEEFLRDLLNEHKEQMLDILDPQIKKVLETNQSSYVMDFTTREIDKELPSDRPDPLDEKEAEDMLASILDKNPDAIEYVKKLTENRKLKKELTKDSEIDSVLSGGQSIKDILNNQNNNNCLKEDNDLKNLRITINESLEVFEQINIQDEEWRQMKENYKELSIKIAEQEVIKNELINMNKKCNIM